MALSDIDPGTPANGGLSALTKREGVADTITMSPAMTQATTDEMVIAAERAWVLHKGDDIAAMRAALEAALAVRKPLEDVNVQQVLKELSGDGFQWASSADNKPTIVSAREIIERQAEDLAKWRASAEQLSERVNTYVHEYDRWCNERAELIEALQRLSKPKQDGGWNFPTVRVEERHQQSARALLERLGAKEGE